MHPFIAIIVEFCNNYPDLQSQEQDIYDFISLPINFGIDEVTQQYQIFKDKIDDKISDSTTTSSKQKATTREQIEETIWNCLVQRK